MSSPSQPLLPEPAYAGKREDYFTADQMRAYGQACAAAGACKALRAERDALKATLSASCDDEREQLWEAAPGGGCSRAIAAETERDVLRAATASVQADLRAAIDQARGLLRIVTAERDALREDAERYRWLRDHCIPEENPQHTWITEAPWEDWDAAIDAAMAQGERREGCDEAWAASIRATASQTTETPPEA